MPAKVLQAQYNHPRTRGEKPCHTSSVCQPAQSPPHTRGKERIYRLQSPSNTITPAHAGKSNPNETVERCEDNHPRTRGEKRCGRFCLCKLVQSPPHTRGKVFDRNLNFSEGAITPAHAGKSVLQRHKVGEQGNHPRTRGEKSRRFSSSGLYKQSPPHTRGKVFSCFGYRTLLTITPAHAGKSNSVKRVFVLSVNHPRTRGEKARGVKTARGGAQSPPHTRGKEPFRTLRACCGAITPAHAGKRLNKPSYYGHSSAAGHRISFNFPMSSYVSRQSVKALCAPRISIPKYSQSAVSVY